MNEQPQKLYRSKTDKIIFGVGGGLAKYFNFEAVWVRIIFILLFLTNGVGLLIYIILAIVLPINPVEVAVTKKEEKLKEFVKEVKEEVQNLAVEIRASQAWRHNNQQFIGVLLVVFGLYFVLRQLMPAFQLMIPWGLVWPVLLIILGLWWLQKKK